MSSPLTRRVSAELLGTGALVATVIGSGVMATDLSDDVGVQLLLNAVATVAALGVLIATLGPVSGAHFNPAVTLVALVRRELPLREAGAYAAAQIVGGLSGAGIANLMFELPVWHASQHDRTGSGLWLGEVVATAGLLFVIGAITRLGKGGLGPVLVPAWIGAAYFFTSSTSFANPAVSLARSTSDTFAGIAPASVPGFVIAQLVGAGLGAVLTSLFYPRPETPSASSRPTSTHRLPEGHTP